MSDQPLSLLKADSLEERDVVNAAADEGFDCCSRYRECSDKCKCVHPDPQHSILCRYKSKLETGTVYFGKNSIGFDPKRYAEMIELYETLSSVEKELLKYICNNLISTYSQSMQIKPSAELSHLDELGFIHSWSISVQEKYDILNSVKKNDLLKESETIRGGSPLKAKPLKSELIEWILENSPEIVNHFSANRYYVEITDKQFPYIYELYNDCLVNLGDIEFDPYTLSDFIDNPYAVYGQWDNLNQVDIEQIERMLSGRKIKITDITMYDDYCTIKGSASKPYRVTLDDCECMDFATRGGPCKHMYRYAQLLGYPLPIPKLSENPSFDIEQEIERYKELYVNSQIPPEAYVAIVKTLKKIRS